MFARGSTLAGRQDAVSALMYTPASLYHPARRGQCNDWRKFVLTREAKVTMGWTERRLDFYLRESTHAPLGYALQGEHTRTG